MSAVPRLKEAEPIACGVCRRRAVGRGWAPAVRGKPRPVLWVCENDDCIKLASKVYTMSEQHLDAYEERARGEAGDEAGAYLDEIGVTDLMKLRPEEWSAFLDRIILGFEKSLRRQFTEGAAPF